MSDNPYLSYLVFQIAPLAYDTIITCMTVGKALRIRREREQINFGGSNNSNKLMDTFIREGIKTFDPLVPSLLKIGQECFITFSYLWQIWYEIFLACFLIL